MKKVEHPWSAECPKPLGLYVAPTSYEATPVATKAGPTGPLSIFFVWSDIINTHEPGREK